VTHNPLSGVRGLLFDLDGTIYVGKQALPGVIEAVEKLRSKSIPMRFTTNTTTLSLKSLEVKLKNIGLSVDPAEIFGTIRATIEYLRSIGSPTCHLLLTDDPKRDFAEFTESESPEVLLIGDIGKHWNYEIMNDLFRMVMNGAEMVALQKGRYWRTEEGLFVDVGAFVAGLEYVTGKTATVVGKPSKSFFELALADLGLPASQVAMVGDDIINDVGGAQAVGMKGTLVRTGKYRQDDPGRTGVAPDLIIDSVANLPELVSHSD